MSGRKFLVTTGSSSSAQALPLKDRLGGVRVLFSHNVQFPRSSAAPRT